jgi:hypothetical protein
VRRHNCLLVVLCALFLGIARPAAASITLAWDANTEPDIAGYIVQYGPTSAPFTVSVDVGNVTTWTFTSAVTGTAYGFQVVAYNLLGERSSPSNPVYTNPDGSVTTLTPDRQSLVFGIVANSTQPMTRTQLIRLTQSGAGTVTWTAQSNAAWLQVSPVSGTGSGAFALSLVPSVVPASNATASVTITASGAANVIAPISVTLDVIPPSAAQPPFGSFDTPVNNTSGVTGSLAVTGWALDDVDVTRVRILRDPVAGETPGQLVYIGDAIQIEDARPDVAGLYPGYPDSYRAGWGYLALTNMLPNGGNGTFRLSVFADDADGHTTLLGTRTITCANATATQPFGAIDTPAQGETVSGTTYGNFGWVLSHGTARADGIGGGTVFVLIDGTNMGSPSGWAARSDLSAIFPVAQYSGINFAEAAFGFNTTTLADGLHTISWVVTDSTGKSAGVGSRFFRVFNGTGPSAGVMAASVSAVSAAGDVASASIDRSTIPARRGFDLEAPFRLYAPDASGRVTLQAEEIDRVELQTHGATEGYLYAGADLRPLPIGSHFDSTTGDFVWQPGAGFVGTYDLTFVHRAAGALTRQDVRIVLNPKGSNRVGPQLVVDIVHPFVAGWAADLDSPSGTGIATIHAWAYPVDASGARGTPLFVGVAAYGGDRPDVGEVYGDQFRASGYGLFVTGLPPGTYDLALFPWSVARGDFLNAAVVRIVVK